MHLTNISRALAALGVVLALWLTWTSYDAYREATAAAERLGAAEGPDGSSAGPAGAVSQRGQALRDLVTFADAVLFGLVALALTGRRAKGAGVILLVLPVLMAASLFGFYPATTTGMYGTVGAFLTFDPAGVLLLFAATRNR